MRRLALAALPLLAACAAPPPPCSPDAAFDRGAQGLGLDPNFEATPEARIANDEGFETRRRLDQLSTFPQDTLSGRRRIAPGAISIEPLEPEAPAE